MGLRGVLWSPKITQKSSPRRSPKPIFGANFQLILAPFWGLKYSPREAQKLRPLLNKTTFFIIFHPSGKGQKQQPKMAPKDSNFEGVWKAFFNFILRPLKDTENSQTGVWLQSGALFQAPEIKFFLILFLEIPRPQNQFFRLCFGVPKNHFFSPLWAHLGALLGAKTGSPLQRNTHFHFSLKPPKRALEKHLFEPFLGATWEPLGRF